MIDPRLEDFRKRLRTAMEKRGITQTDLARRTGTHQPDVSRWCTGTHTPSLRHLYGILTALRVRPDWLLYGDGPMED